MERLRSLRKRQKLTQEDVGKYLGITSQSYSNYENDNREPDFKTIAKLADYFGVTVDYLLGRDAVNGENGMPRLIDDVFYKLSVPGRLLVLGALQTACELDRIETPEELETIKQGIIKNKRT